ncbi:MAG: hypothetical protein QM705_03420 [Ancrocorticia sp.]
MIVLTIDQEGSRREPDRVPKLLERLADVSTIAGFERTVGDEVQGLLDDARAASAAIRCAMRMGGWHVGIGIGQVDDDALAEIRSGSVRTGRGAAFIRAREAVERAKKYPVSVAVVAGEDGGGVGAAPSSTADALQAILHLIGVVVSERTPAQREVVKLLDAGMSGRDIAAALAISEPSVSRRRRLAHVAEESAAWPVVKRLLAGLDRVVAS